MKILEEDYVQLQEFKNFDKKIKEISSMFEDWYFEEKDREPSYWSQLGKSNFSFEKAVIECKKEIKDYFSKEFDNLTKKYKG